MDKEELYLLKDKDLEVSLEASLLPDKTLE